MSTTCHALTPTSNYLPDGGRCQAPAAYACSRSRQAFEYKPAWRQRRVSHTVWQGRRDPLEASIWDSWRGQEEEWETEQFTEDELVDILFEDDGSAETTAQNILAIALSLLLVVALGSILLRVGLVGLALVSAAVRYSIVGVLLLIMVVLFF